MAGWRYNFPACAEVPVSQLDKTLQVAKITEEASETLSALMHDEGSRREVEECLDTIHACETFLRAYPEAFVAEMRDEVEAKNAARGYYGARVR